MSVGDGLVQARGLRKRFGTFEAVRGIDVDVARGEVFGFLGPNGAGKSSTMRMIACVSPRSGGTLTVLGRDPDTDGPADPRPHRRGPAAGQPRRRAHRPAEPAGLRALLRAAPGARAREGHRAAGVRPAHRPRRRAGRAAVGRHEAAAHHRQVAGQRPRAAAARRAHHRARPAGPAPAVGAAVPAQARGRHPDHHHALHGRGRAAVRPARGHGRRGDRRRGLARRADRALLHPRGAGAAVRARGRGPSPAQLEHLAERVEELPDRLLLYAGDGEHVHAQVLEAGLRPLSALVRRSTLEDVFLRLTGRSLVE